MNETNATDYKMPTLESPLIEFKEDNIVDNAPLISIHEEAFLYHYILRLNKSNSLLIEKISEILEVDFPIQVNSVFINENMLLCCLSPDEWLLIFRNEDFLAKVKSLSDVLLNHHALLSEISGGQTILQLKGLNVRKVLAKGAMFDTHPKVFKVGQCGQTVLAQSPVLFIPMINDLESNTEQYFLIIIRRSFSDHMARWLKDACLEYS